MRWKGAVQCSLSACLGLGHMVFIEAQSHELMAAEGYAKTLSYLFWTEVTSFCHRGEEMKEGPKVWTTA